MGPRAFIMEEKRVSHYSEIPLTCKDKQAVIDAMIACGIPKEHIEVHDKPQLLKDYQGNTSKYRYSDHQDERFSNGDQAHIVVRRQHLGSLQNDMGVYLDGDKSQVFICDFARNNKSFTLNKFSKEYNFAAAKRHLAKAGKILHRVDAPDGKIHAFVKAS